MRRSMRHVRVLTSDDGIAGDPVAHGVWFVARGVWHPAPYRHERAALNSTNRRRVMSPRDQEAQRRRIRDHAETFLRQLAEDTGIPGVDPEELARHHGRDAEGLSCWLVYVACLLAGGSPKACTELRERCEKDGVEGLAES